MQRTIKRELDITDDDTIKYLLDNMVYATDLYNIGVDIVKDIKRKDKSTNIDQHTLNKLVSEVRYKRDTEYYCHSLERYACYELIKYLHDVQFDDIHFDPETIKYRQCNEFKGQFTLGNYKYKTFNGDSVRTVMKLTKDSITIRFNKYICKTFYIKEFCWNTKKEPFIPTIQNINNIGIVHKKGKFFIYLNINQ